MVLHENVELFLEKVKGAAKMHGVSLGVILRDYYVSLLLREICKKYKDTTVRCLGSGRQDTSIVALDMNKKKLFGSVMEKIFHEVGVDMASCRWRGGALCEYLLRLPHRFCLDGTPIEIILSITVREDGRGEYSLSEAKPWESMLGAYVRQSGSGIQHKLWLESYGFVPFNVNMQDIRYILCEELIALGSNYLKGVSKYSAYSLYEIKRLVSNCFSFAELRDAFLRVVAHAKAGLANAALWEKNLEDLVYKAMVTDFYKDAYLALTQECPDIAITYADCKWVIFSWVYSGLLNTISDSSVYRNLTVMKLGDSWCVRQGMTEHLMQVDKEYLRSNCDRLINKKFTADGKLVDRFK